MLTRFAVMTALPALTFALAVVAGIAFIWVLLTVSRGSEWGITSVGIFLLASYASYTVTRRLGVWAAWPVLGALTGSAAGVLWLFLAFRNMD